MKTIIEIRNLVKKFGDFSAVDNINLDIKEGEIFGLLGPNGAGKTTTISMILGIVKPSSGKILVYGIDNLKEREKIKHIVGLMTQETIVDSELTAYQNLEIAGRLYHISKNDIDAAIQLALEEAELTEFKDKKAGSFSGGMKRRLYLVKSMIQKPKVIILDEPTTGLDIQNRTQMWTRIKELNRKGITTILTTQYLEEADQLCNRIAIIDHGKIIALGTTSELKKMISKGQILEIITNKDSVSRIMDILESKFGLKSTAKEDKIESFVEKDEVETLSKVINTISKEKLPLISISLHLPTLDDVFIKLTGSSMRDTLGENKSDRSSVMLKR
ncbi:ATP-binding cassette domain-containing protein [Candidatus Marsarchaeota archaeon]|nr:ATP-binding cassette domain-containing protein [Candidatus Marsarchaeota archaeon]MCL5089831.1 ATP-binding cassette domain-containing protein [Candidatus Marsarchaeota archaeon]